MSSASPVGTGKAAARTGRVRLRRFSALAIPATLAGGALVVLTAQGVLAAQFAISGVSFTVTANQLTGNGLQQYGGVDDVAPGSPNLHNQNGQEAVFISTMNTAQLTNLCQSVSIGFTNLVIHAGQGSSPVQADDLVVDSSALTGTTGTFTNLHVDQDAHSLTENTNLEGPLGTFGQQADKVVITNVRQTNWATTASTFTLPGLSIGFSGHGC